MGEVEGRRKEKKRRMKKNREERGDAIKQKGKKRKVQK
jgi:hypothetical protein